MSPLPDSRQHLARRYRRPRDTPIWKLEAVLKCRALQRLRSLRKEAADEIDRLLAILDTIDDTDVDSQYDDDPIDDLEEEPSPGWTDTQAQSGRDSDYAGNDCELDKCDALLNGSTIRTAGLRSPALTIARTTPATIRNSLDGRKDAQSLASAPHATHSGADVDARPVARQSSCCTGYRPGVSQSLSQPKALKPMKSLRQKPRQSERNSDECRKS